MLKIKAFATDLSASRVICKGQAPIYMMLVSKRFIVLTTLEDSQT